MTSRQYRYVGPAEIRDRSLANSPVGVPILSKNELLLWVASRSADNAQDGSLTATFTVCIEGSLLLAPRRSEHVACAGGGPVLSACEITFADEGEVCEISNQSTGFCPEPRSWPAVAAALDAIPVIHPGEFTTSVVFRLCSNCDERSIVKDSWFVCELCGSELAESWNFPLG